MDRLDVANSFCFLYHSKNIPITWAVVVSQLSAVRPEIVAQGFKKLPKVQKIAKSGHTGVRVVAFNTKGSWSVSRRQHFLLTTFIYC